MTLPENLNLYVSAALFVIGAYVAALYVGMIVWVYRDIHSRSRDVLAQILSVLLVALFTIPGLMVYLLLRPHGSLAEEYQRSLTEEVILQDLEERRVCPSCQLRVEPDFVVCPNCHGQLRLRCVGCGRLLNPAWDVCPYCGLFKDQPDDGEHEPDLGPTDDLIEDADAQITLPEPAHEALPETMPVDEPHATEEPESEQSLALSGPPADAPLEALTEPWRIGQVDDEENDAGVEENGSPQ